MPDERDAGSKPADAASEAIDRPNLEPINAAAHPPQNRRIPTQPPISLVFEHEPPCGEARSPSGPPLRPQPSPQLSPRHSPTPLRRGLFSSKRSINLAAGVAVGLVLAIFPAMKLAQRFATPEPAHEQHAAGDDEATQDRGPFMLAWLLLGLPIGLGLGFAPRPGD